jgi:uncharacterized membrane protein
MSNNQNYLNQFLVNQLTEVTMEIHNLSTQSPANELEVWKINGFYDGLVFRRDWLQIQIDELYK